MVSANLNFTGKYLVLTTQNRKLGISKKITGEERKRLKTLMEEKKGEDFGLVVRTNAAEAEEQVLLEELEKFAPGDVINLGIFRPETEETFYVNVLLIEAK